MRATRVEVSKEGAVPALERLPSLLEVITLGFDVVGDDVLDHGLGTAIGVGGTNRTAFGDGDHVGESCGIAVDGRRRGEDNVADIVLGH